MLGIHEYDRYRAHVRGAVKRSDLTIAWADIDGQRVQLVTGRSVAGPAKLTVLRRLAEREALTVDEAATYLASGVDETRTWLALAVPEGHSIEDLAGWVEVQKALGSRTVAARVVGELASGLREVLKRAPSLPAGGVGDARVTNAGEVTLCQLGELLNAPRLDERELVAELGGWLSRLCGADLDEATDGIARQAVGGAMRHLAQLADALDALSDGVQRADVQRWVREVSAVHADIAPPALLEDLPPMPAMGWNTPRAVTPELADLRPVAEESAPPLDDLDEPTRPVRYIETVPPAGASLSPAGDGIGYSEAPASAPSPAGPTLVASLPAIALQPRRRPALPSIPPPDQGANTALAGAVIGGKYEVVQRMLNGMASRVYEAVRVADGRRVLLELPQPREEDGAFDSEARETFEAEAEALRSLDHPCILRVLDYGVQPEAWLAMEHVEGATLAKLLRTTPSLPVEDVVAIGRRLCGALAVAHENGVVHRNLRPASVLLEGGDPHRARLVDFSLSASFTASSDNTSDGSWLGAPHYLSPEQCDGEPARPESDVYALGTLMFRLLSGKVPFEGKKGVALLRAHISAPVPKLSALGLEQDVPAPVEHVIRRCLEKRPEARYRSAAELDRALASCQDPAATVALEALGHVQPKEPVVVLPNGTALPSRWVAPLVAVLVLAALVAGAGATAGLVYFATQMSGSAPPSEAPRLNRVQRVDVPRSAPAPAPAPAAAPAPAPAPEARPEPPPPPPEPQPRPAVPAPAPTFNVR